MHFPVCCTTTKQRPEQQHMVHARGRNQQGNGSRSCRPGRKQGETQNTLNLNPPQGKSHLPGSHGTTPWSSVPGSPRILLTHATARRDLGAPSQILRCCWHRTAAGWLHVLRLFHLWDLRRNGNGSGRGMDRGRGTKEVARAAGIDNSKTRLQDMHTSRFVPCVADLTLLHVDLHKSRISIN